MIIKQTDKHNNLIEFDPKGRFNRYKVNGEPKKGMTTTIDKRFSGGGLLWWKQDVVFQALKQTLKKSGQPIDLIQQTEDSVRARVKEIESEAATIGTMLHNIAEDYALGKQVNEPATEPLSLMFQKFKNYWDRSGFKVIHSEKTVYSEELDIAGTCDLIVTKDSWKNEEGKQEYALLDIKTSKDFYVNYIIQIHGYKKLVEDSLDIKISKLGILKIPKEPSVDVEMRWFNYRPMYIKALKACHYISKVEEKFNSLTKEYIKQRAKRRPNGKQ
jgi:hypothetical protein